MKYRRKRSEKKVGPEILKAAVKNPVFVKAGAVAAATLICFAGVYIKESKGEVETNGQGQKILRRNGQGEGEKNHVLKAEVSGTEESLNITVSEEMYDSGEIQKIFEESGETLEKLILGSNESLEEVRSDLNFAAQIPDTGIRVSWETDDHNVIDTRGKVYNEELAEDGVPVRLTASLSYGEEKAAYEFYVKVFPPKLSDSEKIMDGLRAALAKADEETRTEDYLILPEEIDGEKVTWRYGTDSRVYAILVLGAGAACMMCVSENQRKKEKDKMRTEQMKRDYPQIIGRFNLYIGAGMTVRRAWFSIAEDYQKRKEKSGERDAYEEMVKTMNQIQNGGAEGECYEEYGVRCGVVVYRKLGTMLSQNLRKGSCGMTELLRKETEEAFEERKNAAKKLGEEAGTKMMIPLFMMLAVVFAIVIMPALFSIRI